MVLLKINMILLNLGDWWVTLSGAQQAFWGIAIVFSILFLIQFVFSLIGLDADADMDGDVRSLLRQLES